MDSSLIDRARNGNEEAITELYRSTFKRAYGIALSIVKNPDDAEDILQESYITAFGKIDQLADGNRFETWLFQIVSNRCKDYLRKKKPILFSEMESDDDDGEALDFEDESETYQPEKAVDMAETSRILSELLDNLPEDQRLILIMRYETDMKISEIAAALGISENTVKSRLSYGIKKMRAEVDKKEKEGKPLFGVLPIGLIPLLRLAKPSLSGNTLTPKINEALNASVTMGEDNVASDRILRTLKTVNKAKYDSAVFGEQADSIAQATKNAATQNIASSVSGISKKAAKKAGKHIVRKIVATVLITSTVAGAGVIIAKPEIVDEAKSAVYELFDGEYDKDKNEEERIKDTFVKIENAVNSNRLSKIQKYTVDDIWNEMFDGLTDNSMGRRIWALICDVFLQIFNSENEDAYKKAIYQKNQQKELSNN